MKKRNVLFILLFILGSTVIGCRQSDTVSKPSEDNSVVEGNAGQDLPVPKVETPVQTESSEQSVNVNELIGAPETYNGQKVILVGKISDVCPGNGWYFYLNDGTGTIKIDLLATDIRLAVNKNGSSVKVYGIFLKKDIEPDIKASKIEL